MKNKTYILILLLCLLSFISHAQQDAIISGKISGNDNKPVANANITVAGSIAGTISNSEGVFLIHVPSGKTITIQVSHISYETDSIKVLLNPGERRTINCTLHNSRTTLLSVEVKDQQLNTNTFSRLDPKTVNFIPTIGSGVEELIKTMPGVASHNELSSQYSVRGGNYDENLVFVNDIEVYRPFLVRSGQQEGLSFLNPDLVSSISFSAGGFDAKYGDKMSSVLDIRYKRPTSFAGSFDLSLLGATAHLEGTVGKKLSYLMGVRYKTNSYFLKGLDVKGNYKTRYLDFQGMVNYEFSKKWELSVLGTFSDNSFKLIPQTQTTTFGSAFEVFKVMIFFDGQEVDHYQNWLSAATLTFKPRKDLRFRLISSIYQASESETYDISGEYWIGALEAPGLTGSGSSGNVTEVLGVGAYLNHARNYLDGTVFNFEHRGNWEKGKTLMQWGIRYQHEFFKNVMNEWELQDSAGYSQPHPYDSLGSSYPPHDSLLLSNVVKSNYNIGDNRYSAFISNSWNFRNTGNDISLTAGVRANYNDLNHQFLLDPRVNLSFSPHWKKNVVFRLSGGYYSQPPTFRELTDLKGDVITGLKAQRAIHVLAGGDLYFNWWGRPFKFVSEVYYKYLTNLIPYEIDNLKIRYFGTNDAYGYSTGIDFRINGEFVKGAESWASISFMKSMEHYNGVWVPRPTDQLVNLSIFFQDYVPGFPSWRVHLTAFYGTGLPISPPNAKKDPNSIFRIPSYKRVDLGLSKQLISDNTRFSSKNPLRAFKAMWLSLEIFNLLGISNTVSYIWIRDITGTQWGVPNYLTPREFNLKLVADF
ncbi:MAG: carboxypeptidase-like regulatory domain-containing protein [Bacteroidetes bacterium]|nr:carboxypeptidase-like regulatory domain-containing protein [Bacteroidota bacterium]